ncbi:MAG: DUF4399 domain-containing protein [Myxococcota bacterium]
MRYWTTLWLAGVVACSGGETSEVEAPAPEEAPAAEPAPEAAPEAAPAAAELPEVPEGARVFFVEPTDGAKLKSPFTVKFGVEGMEVKPAGDVDGSPTGHHHLIIGATGVEEGKQVPADDKHIHFGKGQTETELTLDPGEYDLTLQFADGMHMSYGDKMASTIHITVE